MLLWNTVFQIIDKLVVKLLIFHILVILRNIWGTDMRKQSFIDPDFLIMMLDIGPYQIGEVKNNKKRGHIK